MKGSKNFANEHKNSIQILAAKPTTTVSHSPAQEESNSLIQKEGRSERIIKKIQMSPKTIILAKRL